MFGRLRFAVAAGAQEIENGVVPARNSGNSFPRWAAERDRRGFASIPTREITLGGVEGADMDDL
jgi:hypothetical protein